MTQQIGDDELDTLPDEEFRKRLSYENWNDINCYITDERAFTLLRLARETGNKKRVGIVSEALSRRILVKARAFSLRSSIFPRFINDLNEATAELASYIWEKVFTKPNDAKHAEVAFGQLFKLRAIDFQKRFFAKKRALQESLDALDRVGDSDDPEAAEKSIAEMQDELKPEDYLQQKQEFWNLRKAMHKVLMTNEFETLVLLFDLDMPVKDVANALEVVPRTVQNLRARAFVKLRKELAK